MLMRLYYLDGLTLTAIGAFERVAPSTIMRRLNAVRARVLNDTKHELRDLLQLSTASLDSLIDLVACDLDMSFRRLLDRSEL
jgi:hypothetical protein